MLISAHAILAARFLSRDLHFFYLTGLILSNRFKKNKMFSTFQAIAKVAENLENTKRQIMCNLEKWIIKMVGAMNVTK